jgi:hypothetical protein
LLFVDVLKIYCLEHYTDSDQKYREKSTTIPKRDGLRVKGTEAQRHRVLETHYFFFAPACALHLSAWGHAQAGADRLDHTNLGAFEFID